MRWMGQFSFKMGIELAGPTIKTTIKCHLGATLNMSIIVIKSMSYAIYVVHQLLCLY